MAKRKQSGEEGDIAAARLKDIARRVKRAPKLRFPFGPVCWRTIRFTPENIIGSTAWSSLRLHCGPYRIVDAQLQDMFLRLCDPDDASLGTVHVERFLQLLKPQHRHVVERLLRRPGGASSTSIHGSASVALTSRAIGAGAGDHDRLLFEDAARFTADLCALPFPALAVAAAGSLRDFPALTVTTVRAILRFAHSGHDDNGGGTASAHNTYTGISGSGGLTPLAKATLAHLHPDMSSPFHSSDALAHLCVRYPAVAFGVLSLQWDVQQAFFGRRFWRAYHAAAGSQLFPPDFTREQAAAVTARVIMLESVSEAAVPFVFGSEATARPPPDEALQLVPIVKTKAADGTASADPSTAGTGGGGILKSALAKTSTLGLDDTASVGSALTPGRANTARCFSSNADSGIGQQLQAQPSSTASIKPRSRAIDFDAELGDQYLAAKGIVRDFWSRVKTRGINGGRSARRLAIARMHSIKQAVGLEKRPDAAFKARVDAAIAAETRGHKAAEARIGVTDLTQLAAEAPRDKPAFHTVASHADAGFNSSGDSTSSDPSSSSAASAEVAAHTSNSSSSGGATERRAAAGAQLRTANDVHSLREETVQRWRQAQWEGHTALADDCLELLIRIELEKVKKVFDGDGEWGHEEEERRRAEEEHKAQLQLQLRLGTVAAGWSVAADPDATPAAGGAGATTTTTGNRRRSAEVIGGYGQHSAAAEARAEEVRRQEAEQFKQQKHKERLLRAGGESNKGLGLSDRAMSLQLEDAPTAANPLAIEDSSHDRSGVQGALEDGDSEGSTASLVAPLLSDAPQPRSASGIVAISSSDGNSDGLIVHTPVSPAPTVLQSKEAEGSAQAAGSGDDGEASRSSGTGASDEGATSAATTTRVVPLALASASSDGSSDSLFALMPAEMRRDVEATKLKQTSAAADAALAHFQKRHVDNRSIVEKLLNPVDKTIPMPVPPAQPDYMTSHPPPHGAKCTLTSLQIALQMIAHTASGAGASFAVVEAPCLFCGQMIKASSGDEDKPLHKPEPTEPAVVGKPLEALQAAAAAGGDSGLVSPRRGPPKFLSGRRLMRVAPDQADGGQGSAEVTSQLCDVSGIEDAPAEADASDATAAADVAEADDDVVDSRSASRTGSATAAGAAVTEASHVAVTKASNVTADYRPSAAAGDEGEEDGDRAAQLGGSFIPPSSKLRNASSNHQALQDRLEKAAARRREIERRMQMAREIAEGRKRAASREAARRTYDSTRSLLLVRANAEAGGSAADANTSGPGAEGALVPLARPSSRASAAAAAADVAIEDELEDAAVREITAELGRLPPPANGVLADDDDTDEKKKMMRPQTSDDPASDALVAHGAEEPSQSAVVAVAAPSGGTSSDGPVTAGNAFGMHGFQPRAPDASIKGRRAVLRGAKRGNTGFCAQCDAYIYGLLAHLFGFTVADLVLDAAAIQPSAVDQMQAQTKRAAQTGHPLAPPLPPGVAAGDIPAVVGEQGAGFDSDDDLFLELFDEASRKMFYYNVATGDSQWAKPSKYRPFKDRPAAAAHS